MPRADPSFERLLPRLYAVGRALGRRGVLRTYGELGDLVHDFYLDVWPGLQERFDPALGDRDTYALSAFARFARRRAARDAELRERLLPEVDVAGDGPPPAELIDLARTRDAVAGLDERDASVLALLFRDGLSERQAAREAGLSRFLFRERAARALATLAALLDPSAFRDPRAHDLARRLLVDGEPLSLAARESGLSISRARQIHRTTLAGFAAALRNTRS